MRKRGRSGGREILFEFLPMGNSIRVSAIDTLTNTEVTIVGDVRETQATLERVAMRKLLYVLRKKQEQAGQG